MKAARPTFRFLVRHPAHFLALGFGAGLAPFAPATSAPLVAIPIAHGLRHVTGDLGFVLAVVMLFAAGVWASAVTSRNLGVSDHGAIVVDEIAAFLLVLFFTGTDPFREAVAFLLFRFFDVVKPPPARGIDRNWHGGFGVMADDIVAAGSLGKNISPEVLAIIANLDDAGRLADLSASNLDLKVEDAQSVLDIIDPVARLRKFNDLLNKEIEVLTVQQEINTQARADIDRSQREFFLRQQLKAIQSELGEGNELFEEIEQYRDKILKSKMPELAEEEALRQLKKLERMHPDTAETATLRNWLDIMTDLPWSTASEDNLDITKAEKILDEDHFGLERVKERIVEALAVRKLVEKPKGSILCLVGPPGVGKTSLGCQSPEP